MAKTKIFDKTELDNIYIILTHNKDGSTTARVNMVGKAISRDGSEETVSQEHDYAELASAEKNQVSNLVKFLSKLFNQTQVDENSETVGELK